MANTFLHIPEEVGVTFCRLVFFEEEQKIIMSFFFLTCARESNIAFDRKDHLSC